jgi:predicted TIM-barrel fold metal-dependent hydrolase
MEELDSSKILFGTDFPIMTWHGMREWHTDAPTNFAREDFSWNRHEKGVEAEIQFTFIAYEQLNNILNAIGNNTKVLQQIFYENAKGVFKGRN